MGERGSRSANYHPKISKLPSKKRLWKDSRAAYAAGSPALPLLLLPSSRTYLAGQQVWGRPHVLLQRRREEHHVSQVCAARHTPAKQT